jgi:hypothetical protein
VSCGIRKNNPLINVKMVFFMVVKTSASLSFDLPFCPYTIARLNLQVLTDISLAHRHKQSGLLFY